MSPAPEPTRRSRAMMLVLLGGPIGVLVMVWREALLGVRRPGMFANDAAIVFLTTALMLTLLLAFWRQLGVRVDRDGVRQPFSARIPWEAVVEVLVKPGTITLVSDTQKIAISLSCFSDPRDAVAFIEAALERSPRLKRAEPEKRGG